MLLLYFCSVYTKADTKLVLVYMLKSVSYRSSFLNVACLGVTSKIAAPSSVFPMLNQSITT